MKNEKGITLLAVVITVVILAILSFTAINYGVNSMDSVKLQNFRYELEQIQGKVDAIYEKIKLGDNSYIILGSDITSSEEAMNTLEAVKRIDYSNIAEEQREQYYYTDQTTYYRYLSEYDLGRELNITSNPGDVIINFKTREVISVKGFTYKNETYYTLEQFK